MTILNQFQGLSSDSQYLVSEYFIDQLRNFPNNEAFFIKADALQQRYFELVLTNPVTKQEADGYVSVLVKLQINHLVQPQGEGDTFKLLNLKKGGNQRQGQFCKGFYTPTLEFNKSLVEAGLLTEQDMVNLRNYAASWEANGENNYKQGTAAAKARLWLTPRANKGYVTFVMSERSDVEGNMVPAVEEFAWTPGDFHLIGNGAKEPAQQVRAARTIVMTTDAPTVTTNTVVGTRGI